MRITRHALALVALFLLAFLLTVIVAKGAGATVVDPNNTPPGDPHVTPVLALCADFQFDPEPGTEVRVRFQVEADSGYTADETRSGTADADGIVHVDVADLVANRTGRYRAALPDIFGPDTFTPWHPFDCQDCAYDSDYCPPVTTTTPPPPTTPPPTVGVPPTTAPPTVTTTTAPCDPNDAQRCGMPDTGAATDGIALTGGIALATGLGLVVASNRRRSA